METTTIAKKAKAMALADWAAAFSKAAARHTPAVARVAALLACMLVPAGLLGYSADCGNALWQSCSAGVLTGLLVSIVTFSFCSTCPDGFPVRRSEWRQTETPDNRMSIIVLVNDVSPKSGLRLLTSTCQRSGKEISFRMQSKQQLYI
jgi:hypothetical protein